MSFSRIEEAIAAMARGEMIIVVDDEDRENEGDIVVAAEAVTPEMVAFMMKHARGLICVSATGERLDELELPLMVTENSESMKTAFTVSIDYLHGTSTGISSADRAATIRAMVDPAAMPADFARPGHIFPLRANAKGVLGRPGHTEAAVDLAKLAGRQPCGVICEIANDDGTMARLPELQEFARLHGLLIITIEDLIAYRRQREPMVERVSDAELPTKVGSFRAIAYRDPASGLEHLALVMGSLENSENPLVRIHSECVTGEALGSLRCDCGDQLQQALSMIEAEGTGCVVYLRGQEGRGIGLGNKIAAYGLQDCGLDTYDANRALGLPADDRDYSVAAEILSDLKVKQVRLLTNNPDKVAGLERCGVTVHSRRGLLTAVNAANASYLRAKKERFGHFLETA